MKPVTLIASDMDGTLLTSQHVISHRTQKSIQAAVERGIRFVIASGRPWPGIAPYVKELGLDRPGNFCVSNNGALIHEADSGSIVNSHTLSIKDYCQIATLAQQLGVHCHAVTAEKIYTPNRDISPYTVREAFLTNMPLEYCPVSEMNKFLRFSKIMLIDEPELLSEALQRIPQQLYTRFTMVKSSPFFFEVLNTKASKGNAVEWVANYCQIKMEQVMCLGDHENDVSMLERAGFGVAMGNAVPAAAQAANIVTLDNDSDGVALAIERYALTTHLKVV